MDNNRYSNAKHWCLLCKTFVQRDAKSIKFHEEGLRHQGQVKRKLQLAARKRDQHEDTTTTTQHKLSSPPLVDAAAAAENTTPMVPPVMLRKDEILGQYSVRNQVYFQGEFHEDLLQLPSSRIELSVLDEEGEFQFWAPCTVVHYNPHYNDSEEEEAYTVSFQNDDKTELALVRASDLRIVGPSDPPSLSLRNQWSGVVVVSKQEEFVEEKVEEPSAIEYYKGVALVDLEEEDIKKPLGGAPIAFRKRNKRL